MYNTAFSYNKHLKLSSSWNMPSSDAYRFSRSSVLGIGNSCCSVKDLPWNPNSTEINGIYCMAFCEAWISPLDERVTTQYFICFLTIPPSQIGHNVFLWYSSKWLFLLQHVDRCQPYWNLFKLTQSETLVYCLENKLSISIHGVHSRMFQICFAGQPLLFC